MPAIRKLAFILLCRNIYKNKRLELLHKQMELSAVVMLWLALSKHCENLFLYLQRDYQPAFIRFLVLTHLTSF